VEIKEELIQIVGGEHVSDDPEALKPYSKDYSLRAPGMPNYVVYPKSSEEIQGLVKLASKYKIPLIPCSSGVHFRGTTIPTEGGIILDLRRMNSILEVSERDRFVRIEPGVTWPQLEGELHKQELMTIVPLLPHPQGSVITSLLEREVPLNCMYEFAEPLLTLEAVFPNGEAHRSGSASVKGATGDAVAVGVNPQGPGIDWFRLLQGAQGTMGIVTWGIIKIEYLPQQSKVFFIPFDRVERAIEPLYRIQRRMIGQECFVLNDFNLASILAEKWPEDFTNYRESFAPLTLVIVLTGARRRPEEKLAYEEEALREVGAEFNLDIQAALPGALGTDRKLPTMLRQSWPEGVTYWKHRYKGGCQDLFFVTTMEKVPELSEAMGGVATKHGYPLSEMGFYLQPIERGRACHCEFNLYYDPEDSKDRERIRNLYDEAAEVLVNMGAFFTRPYDGVSDLVYSRATEYTAALKKVKNLFDPDNIMCPGNLCF
jgi:FAD/FMN-containing dehydrogenase